MLADVVGVTNRPSARTRAAEGAVLIGTTQLYRMGVGFVSNIVLARLLTPADFGLVAMVSSCVALVMLIQDLGLNQATIQRAQISLKQMSALFWLSAGSGLILAALVALSAPGIAWFFRDPRLTTLTLGFAVLIALGGTQSQQLALMTREFRFKALAGIDVLATTAGAMAGITIAWLTSSYWALFTATLMSTVASVGCVWLLSGFRPGRPSFEGDFKEIVGFGSGVSGFNVVNYFGRNADNLLIGRFYGGEQLGYYDRAYRLLLFPLSQIQAPLGRVMLPVLARLQSEPERYRKAYTDCVSLLMMATQPGIVFMIVFAEDLFRALLGAQWTPAAQIFQWLGICGLHQVATSTLGWLFLSQGRGGDFFKIGLFNAVISVVSFVVGLLWGALGVAIAYAVINYAVLLPVTWSYSGNKGPVSARDLVANALPHGVATLAAAAALAGAATVLTATGAEASTELVALSYVTYGLVMLAHPAKRVMLSRELWFAFGVLLSFSRPKMKRATRH
jgi:PST family polysaccharide transporter